jgi:hypothetical protein
MAILHPMACAIYSLDKLDGKHDGLLPAPIINFELKRDSFEAAGHSVKGTNDFLCCFHNDIAIVCNGLAFVALLLYW